MQGCRRLSQEEVKKLSGVTPQNNLLALDRAAIEKAVQTNSWVRRVNVRRQLPDVLLLEVEERLPVALVNTGGLNVVDKDGTVIEELVSGSIYNLPVITGLTAEEMARGKLPMRSERALTLLALASRGGRILGAANISQIDVQTEGGLVVYTADQGVSLRFGPDNLSQQFRRAEQVLYHLYLSGRYRGVAEIDLEYGPGQAWARLRDS